VQFGGVPGDRIAADSDAQVRAVAPAGTGTVEVTVTTDVGTSASTAGDRFTYT
jgi:hypothetical protein